MRHLQDEDVAGLIDGMVTNEERAEFLAHISNCQPCFTLYANTLKFMEQEETRSVWWRKLFLKVGLPGGFSSIKELFCRKKWLVPTFATGLVILVLLLPLLLPNKVTDDRLRYLAGAYGHIDKHYAFAGSGSKSYAAVRTGVLVAEISLLNRLDSPGKLGKKIGEMVRKDLKILGIEKEKLPKKRAPINMELLTHLIPGTHDELEKADLLLLLDWGRVLEEILLDSYSGKAPERTKVKGLKKQALALRLPRGAVKGLEKIIEEEDILKIRTFCEEIKELFF